MNKLVLVSRLLFPMAVVLSPLAGCSSTPVEPNNTPPRPTTEPATSAIPLTDAGSGATPPDSMDAGDGGAVSSEPAPPAACPADMLLVDGDYCTELQMTCLKSWYAPSNKKTICEVFKEPTVCTGEKVKKRYCMDRYEYPNKKGVRPEVMDNFYMAQVLCANQGKRICTETEWTMA